MKAIETEDSDEILTMDTQHSSYNMALHEMILHIKTRGDNPVQLFHGVGASRRGELFTFAFFPSHTNDARMIINGLIPYLKLEYGSDVKDFVNPDACISKIDWEWNSKPFQRNTRSIGCR